MKILFVCTGNTCRSPMAAAMANHLCKKMGIDKIVRFESAGLVGPAGLPMSSGAKNALKKMGIKPSSKKSRVLDVKKLNAYKFIITMTLSLKMRINAPNCFSISDFCGFEIPDPYLMDQNFYDETAKKIETAVQIIINRISGKGEKQ